MEVLQTTPTKLSLYVDLVQFGIGRILISIYISVQ